MSNPFTLQDLTGLPIGGQHPSGQGPAPAQGSSSPLAALLAALAAHTQTQPDATDTKGGRANMLSASATRKQTSADALDQAVRQHMIAVGGSPNEQYASQPAVGVTGPGSFDALDASQKATADSASFLRHFASTLRK